MNNEYVEYIDAYRLSHDTCSEIDIAHNQRFVFSRLSSPLSSLPSPLPSPLSSLFTAKETLWDQGA